jgi:hypothetical protein
MSKPINLSNIQDFVLNKRNIEKILQHTVKYKEPAAIIRKTIIKKNIVKNSNFLLPKFSDSLFWCYYIISKGISAYEIIQGDGFKDSLEMKIQLVYSVRENNELLKKNKWKRNAIEDVLVNHKTISPSVFMCICAISNLNIIYIDGKKMYTLNDSTNLNIIEKTDNGYSIFIGTDDEKSQKYEEYKQQLWQIENLTKPLRGISSYKVKELREICTKLQLNISNGKTLKKKSILYQMIQECL